MMRWPLSDDDHRLLRDLKIDRLGWILGIAAYLVLLSLAALSVAGKIHPPIEIRQSGADMTDEQLLAYLLVSGVIAGGVVVWLKIARAMRLADKDK